MYKILRRKQLNDTVVRLDVEAPFIAKKAKAGQFIILRIDERGERMPLTIADTNAEEGSVSIIFQIVGQTTMLLSQMNEGDCLLDFVGPLGAATEFGHIKKACVIGGGVGNAIAYPSAKALFNMGVDVDVIAGFRSKDIVILEDEYKEVCNRLFITTDDGTYSESGSDESASDESSSSDESGSSDESTSDETTSDENASDEAGIPEATEDGTYSEDGSDESASDESASTETDGTEPDTSVLSEEAKNNYDKLALFVKGEYEGDADSLLAATESTEEVATVTLDEQTGKNLAATVEKDYYDILNNGTDSYEADGTETYQSTELNMMDRKLKKLFGISAAEDGTDENADVTDETKALLADVTEEDKQTLYKDTMRFLAGLYGENTDSAADESTAE